MGLGALSADRRLGSIDATGVPLGDVCMRRIIATAVLLIVLAAPAWAGLGEGLAAYNRGDYATALRELRPPAEQGDAEAQFRLGRMYAYGQEVQQNYAEAMRWYRKAAHQGYGMAQNNFGRMYGKGLGVPRDYAEAVRWYREAIQQGLAMSRNEALALAQNRGLAVALKKGLAVPQTSLGYMYRKGLVEGI